MAVLAGNYPGGLEMIPGGFIHNTSVSSAQGAGEPDHLADPGAQNIGMQGLGCHCMESDGCVLSGRTAMVLPFDR